MQKTKMPFDTESKRLKRASNRISYLARFEEDPKALVEGLLGALRLLKNE